MIEPECGSHPKASIPKTLVHLPYLYSLTIIGLPAEQAGAKLVLSGFGPEPKLHPMDDRITVATVTTGHSVFPIQAPVLVLGFRHISYSNGYISGKHQVPHFCGSICEWTPGDGLFGGVPLQPELADRNPVGPSALTKSSLYGNHLHTTTYNFTLRTVPV